MAILTRTLPPSVKNPAPTVAVFEDPESGACSICKVAVAGHAGFCEECERLMRNIWATLR